MLSLSARPEMALYSSAKGFDDDVFDVAASIAVSADFVGRLGGTGLLWNMVGGVEPDGADVLGFAEDEPVGASVAPLSSPPLSAGVTISNIESICGESSRDSGDMDGRSRSSLCLPSRTGLSRDARALLLGGSDDAMFEELADIMELVPERMDAPSDALSECIPGPRPAANSLTRALSDIRVSVRLNNMHSRIEVIIVDFHAVIRLPDHVELFLIILYDFVFRQFSFRRRR